MVGSGCVQRITTATRVEHADTTMEIDEAMQIRDWDRSTAYYTNQGFVAGATGFWFQPAYYQPEWVYPILETPLFLGQALILPVTIFFPPPWADVRYAGATIEPTYHGVPPLPPPVAGSEEALPTEAPPAPPESTGSDRIAAVCNVDAKSHWDSVYSTKRDDELSWFQPEPAISLELIQSVVSPPARVIDVGGGTSSLGATLASREFRVTVLDV
jgi:hypothetical protein